MSRDAPTITPLKITRIDNTCGDCMFLTPFLFIINKDGSDYINCNLFNEELYVTTLGGVECCEQCDNAVI